MLLSVLNTGRYLSTTMSDDVLFLLCVGRPSVTRLTQVLTLRLVLTARNDRLLRAEHWKTHHMLMLIILCHMLMSWRTTMLNWQNVDDLLIILQVITAGSRDNSSFCVLHLLFFSLARRSVWVHYFNYLFILSWLSNDLVLSQEDTLQAHRMVHEILIISWDVMKLPPWVW